MYSYFYWMPTISKFGYYILKKYVNFHNDILYKYDNFCWYIALKNQEK